MAVLLLAVALYAWAGTTGPATGGTAISADTAETGGSGAWTSLTGPTYAELFNGDLAVGDFVTLTAPAGFEFNLASPVTVVLIQGDDKQAAANMNETPLNGIVASAARRNLTVTETAISFRVSSKSRGNTLNTIRWVGIQVRPLQGTPLVAGSPLPSGPIRLTVPAGSLLPSSPNAGTLTVVPGALARLLTVLPGQSYVSGTGVTGAASPQTVGVPFNVQLVATDQFNNRVTTYNGDKDITYAGPAVGCSGAPMYTTRVNFTSGSSTTILPTRLFKVENTTITASEPGVVSGLASSPLIIDPAAMSRLVVTLPGQTFTPCVGNSGTPQDQAAGVPFNISITATDDYFNVVTAYDGPKTLSYTGPAGPVTYTTGVTFSLGRATGVATTIANGQENAFIRASDGTITGPDSAKFAVKSSVSAFNAFETSTAASAVAGVIKTKIAGTSFELDLVALTSTPAVSTGFTGTVKVEIVQSGSGTCQTLPLVKELPNQTFSVTDAGRHRVTGIVEADSWQDVQVRISHPVTSPTIVSCSGDRFAIRPDRFNAAQASHLNDTTPGTARALANSTVPGGEVHKAGRLFTISATAVGSAGATTKNYATAPTAIMSQCSVTGVCPSMAAAGTLSITSWSATLGVVTTSNASYSDVGVFSLVLRDQGFADVDIGDSTPEERLITSATFTVGRFVPDHYVVEPISIVPRSDMATCSSSVFTYMDEPFDVKFRLIARNAAPANAPVKSYQGVLATLNPAKASQLGVGGVDKPPLTAAPIALVAPVTAITRATLGRVTTGTAHGLTSGATVFLSGVGGMTEVNDRTFKVTVAPGEPFNFTIDANTEAYSIYTSGGHASRFAVSASAGTWALGVTEVSSTIMLQRLPAPDGPFDNVSIGVAPRDPDGITLAGFNLDADANGDNERFTLGPAKLWFGRLKLGNAYGNELLNMRIPIQTQFWAGTGFRQNADDDCTAISLVANIPLSNYLGGISAANFTIPGSVVIGGQFKDGVGSLMLKKPVAPPAIKKGSVDITVKLDAETKKYLKGRGAGALYDQDPVSRATFGLYKTGPVIYTRETY